MLRVKVEPQIADENKTQIAKSGALVPLTRLAKSKDMRVQRNATGALLNMTHSGQSGDMEYPLKMLSCQLLLTGPNR